MRKKVHFFIFICVISISFSCNKSNDGKDFMKTHKLPYLAEAQNVSYINVFDKKVYGIYYSINEPFPSMKAIKYYNDELRKMDFEIVNPINCDINTLRNWFFVNEANPIGAQMDAYWINRKTRFFAWLSIYYKWGSNKKNLQKQTITLRYIYMNESVSIDNIDMQDIHKLVGNEIKKQGHFIIDQNVDLVYPGGNIIRFDNSHSSINIEYIVKINYPSMRVLDFYKKYFSNKNYELLEIKNPPWNTLSWRKGNFQGVGERKLYSFAAFLDSFWKNNHEQKLAWLHCEYFWDDETKKNLEQNDSQRIILKQINLKPNIKIDISDFQPMKLFEM